MKKCRGRWDQACSGVYIAAHIGCEVKYRLGKSEILAEARMKSADADEIHFVDEMKSVLSPAA